MTTNITDKISVDLNEVIAWKIENNSHFTIFLRGGARVFVDSQVDKALQHFQFKLLPRVNNALHKVVMSPTLSLCILSEQVTPETKQIHCGRRMLDKYQSCLPIQQRFVNQIAKGAGYRNLMYDLITVIEDTTCPDGTLYGVSDNGIEFEISGINLDL